MAITFQKQPLSFFNVNEPAIFEFTTDLDLGANPNDLVADLELKSLITSRRYVIKNILPKYGTGVFRVDVSGYLKSLQLDNFDYRFDSANKQNTIENYQIGVTIHAENITDPTGDAYVFDSGYIFDETFIFAEDVPNDTEVNGNFFPVVGMNHRSDTYKPTKNPIQFNILAPEYVEFAEGFSNTLSIFTNLTPGGVAKRTSVNGSESVFTQVKGVSTATITNSQIRQMYLPALIQVLSPDNPAIKVYGISYKASECEETLQFRFFNSYGGYSYFYTPKEGARADRSKSEFINNDFYNQQDNRSPQMQRAADYSETLNLSGIKEKKLVRLYMELLRSPKIEVLLPQGLFECEVRGGFNDRELDFEYNLTVTVSNLNQMTL